MPIVKPAALPRFGEPVGSQGVVGPNETAPNAAKQDVGWIPGEEPPAGYFNWFKRLTYDWLQYLNDLPNQALTWVGQQQFSGNKLLHVGDPAAADDAATKNYVDVTDKAAGHTWSAAQAFSAATVANAPVNPTDAARKTELDAITAVKSIAHLRFDIDEGDANFNLTQSADTKFNSFAHSKVIGAGLVTDGTGRVTVQAGASGTYRIAAAFQSNANASTAGQSLKQKLYKNGVFLAGLGFQSTNATNGAVLDIAGEVLVDLVAGDYVELFYNVTGSAASCVAQYAQFTVDRKA